MVSSGLSLFNFETGIYATLSYKTQLLSITNSSGLVNLQLVGPSVKIIYLAFSVLIITEHNIYVELVSIEVSSITDASEWIVFSTTYSKFNNSQPIVQRFF